jgi:hypothetical protein
MLPYPRTQNRATKKKRDRTHLVDEDLAWERWEGIKARRPTPHTKLPPVSWYLHENKIRKKGKIAVIRAVEGRAHRKSDVGARAARGAGGGGHGGEGRRRGGGAEATRLHGTGKETGREWGEW